MLSTRTERETFRMMRARGQRILVLAARQPEFVSLLEDAGYEVDTRTRPLGDENIDADVAVVFRGRVLGRNQAALLERRGVPVIEVMTVEPPGVSTESWLRLSNRIPKPDLVQVVHALAAWSRNRDRTATAAA
jgi:hypothetical protein